MDIFSQVSFGLQLYCGSCSFTGVSGYDFGYFLKLLTNEPLPMNEDAFFELLQIWFPNLYDIKLMVKATNVLKGGLQDIANDLGVRVQDIVVLLFQYHAQVPRVGLSHQAGSDSLLTASAFFKMREDYFNNTIDDKEYSGKLFGLGSSAGALSGIPDPSRTGMTTAEREDRMPMRELHNQTPGSGGMSSSQSVSMGGISMGTGGIPAPMPMSSYGPLGTNGPYMRTSLVGGR